MTLDYDKRHYSYDSTTAEFQFDDTDVTTDDRGTNVWWDAQPTVSAEDVPSYYNDFFDAEQYYAIDTVVAKEVPQQYWIDGDEYTFVKPNDELRQAVWSLDGKPYTLTHPSEGAVRSTDDIHGFWGQPKHDDDSQESSATLYFPTHDDDAREFVADHDNVSVGFVNTLVKSDRDGIDAHQTDLYYDHVASVKRGRCDDEDGCGLQGFASGTDSETYVPASTIPISDMKGPSNLSDPDTTQESSFNTDNSNSTMTVCNDCGNDNGGKDSMTFSIDDFGVRKVRKENDAVDEAISEKEDKIDDLESELDSMDNYSDLFRKIADRLTDDADDASGQDIITELDSLQDSYEEVQEEMESVRTDERDDLLSEVKSLADGSAHERFEQRDNESVTDHIDRLTDAKELLESAVGDTSATTTTTRRTTTTDDGGSSYSSSPGDTVSGEQFADISDF